MDLNMFLRGGFSPAKPTNKFADGLLRTLECNDTSRL